MVKLFAHARESNRFPVFSLDPLDPKRLRVVLATITINVFMVALLTLALWPEIWRTGLASELADNALLLGFIFLHRDGLLGRLVLFGLFAWIRRTFADAWLVTPRTRWIIPLAGGSGCARHFVRFGCFLAWEVVAVQFGYLGLRFQEHFGSFGVVLTGNFWGR